MSYHLWIAIVVTAVTIAAHVLLFWWFLCKKQTQPENDAADKEELSDD